MKRFQDWSHISEIIAEFQNHWAANVASLSQFVVIKSLIKARERRINDGFDGTIKDGCKEVIEILFEGIDECRSMELASELESWLRSKSDIGKDAEGWLRWVRNGIFIEGCIPNAFPMLAAKEIDYSSDAPPRTSERMKYETPESTFNRYLSYIDNEDNNINKNVLLETTMAVMGCKRLGADVLGWRY